MHKLIQSLFIVLLSFSTLTGCDDILTVYIVRHAEKMSPWSDNNPPLSPAGYQRADALAERFKTTELDKVIVSTYRRTQETAAPTAEAQGLSPIIIPANEIEEIVAEIQQSSTTRAVLVVGHSNTVPSIIEALHPNANVQEIAEDVFNQFHVVIRNKLNQATVHAQDDYGAP